MWEWNALGVAMWKCSNTDAYYNASLLILNDSLDECVGYIDYRHMSFLDRVDNGREYHRFRGNRLRACIFFLDVSSLFVAACYRATLYLAGAFLS